MGQFILVGLLLNVRRAAGSDHYYTPEHTCVLHGSCERAENGADLSQVHLLQIHALRASQGALSRRRGGRHWRRRGVGLRGFRRRGGSL